MKIQWKEKYWIGNLRHVTEKVRLKLENKVEFGKGRRNLENEAGIGNVEDRKSKEGIKNLGIAKVRQGMEKVRLKLENKVVWKRMAELRYWGGVGKVEVGNRKNKAGKVKK